MGGAWRTWRRVAWAAVVLMAAFVGYRVWAQRNPPQTAGPASPLVGQVAPDFTLPTLQGGTVELSRLRGKPVYLNFFNTWCPPCKAETPDLVALSHEMGGKVTIIGVNLTAGEAGGPVAVARFVRAHRIPYRIALDRTGSVADAYLVSAIPESVFIGPHGHVRQVVVGEMTLPQMRRAVQGLLGP